MCVGLVYWGLMPQQQPGSYILSRRYNDDDEISFLVEETGVPGGNHRPTASVCWCVCVCVGGGGGLTPLNRCQGVNL